LADAVWLTYEHCERGGIWRGVVLTCGRDVMIENIKRNGLPERVRSVEKASLLI
jgi:hypothetical protein